MTNISNPELRPRDVRKVVKSLCNTIVWEQGCDSNNEWVFASLESEEHKSRLLDWLKRKNILPTNEVVITNSAWHNLKLTTWSKILASPESYFGKEQVEIYDSNLKWLLEYQVQEIARFGRFQKASNA